MKNDRYSSKITSQHLERKAIIYLRQSTEKQVQKNKESQRLQYALADRARELGFRKVEAARYFLNKLVTNTAKFKVLTEPYYSYQSPAYLGGLKTDKLFFGISTPSLRNHVNVCRTLRCSRNAL
ncbi:hypothetical protein ES703_28586 [subsurface metagenome]